MYYKTQGDEGAPEDWIRRMKQSLMYLSPQFNSQRMVGEYMAQLYEPAHLGFVEMARNSFEPARERALWNRQVNQVWDRVNFVETGPGPDATGAERPADSDAGRSGPGWANPDDVRVEAVIGRVDRAVNWRKPR